MNGRWRFFILWLVALLGLPVVSWAGHADTMHNDTLQIVAKNEQSLRLWSAMVFLNTFPQEAGLSLHQWNHNPAQISDGALTEAGIYYETYDLIHETVWQNLQRKMKVSNEIYEVKAAYGSHSLGFALSYARRIKETGENPARIDPALSPPASFKEISNIISPTLVLRSSFGLNFAVRINMHQVETISNVDGQSYSEHDRIVTIDAGFRQKLGDLLYLNVFANQLKMYVNGQEMAQDSWTKYLNLGATLHWKKYWINGGVQLNQWAGTKDTLLFLKGIMPLNQHWWAHLFFAHSQRYEIFDMDVNLPAPLLMVGGGLHWRYKHWIVSYQLQYLSFSPDTSDALSRINLVKRDHFRHRVTVLFAL